MQKTLQDKAQALLRRQKNRRRVTALLTALSLCAAMGTFRLQTRLASTLTGAESAAVQTAQAVPAAADADTAADSTAAVSAAESASACADAADSAAAESAAAAAGTVSAASSASSAASSAAESAADDSAAESAASPAASDSKSALLQTAALGAEADTSKDFGPYITSVTVTDGGKTVTTVADGDNISVQIAFQLPAGFISTDSRTISYQLPDGIKVTQAQSGNIYDTNNVCIAQYTISTGGLVTITATEAFAAGSSAMKGTVTFSGSASNSSTTKDATVTFGGSGGSITIKHADTTADTDLSVYKQAELQTDGKLHYTVEVYSDKGTADTVSLTDVLSDSDLLYDSGSFVITAPDGTQLDTGTYLTRLENGSFAITGLPKLAAGERYTITYTATPDSNFFPSGTTGKNVHNDVTATSGGQSKSTSSWSWLSLLQKSGSYNASTGLITWTITLNQAHTNLKGYTFSDVMTKPDGTTEEYTGTAQVSPSLGGSSTVTLPYTFSADDTNTYTFTYTTQPDTSDIGTKTYDNKATLTNGGKTYTADSGSVHVDSAGHVVKEFLSEKADADGSGSEYIWKSTMTVPSTGITTSYFCHDILDHLSGQLLITAQTAQDFSLVGVKADGTTVTLTEGTDYSVTFWHYDPATYQYTTSYGSTQDLISSNGTASDFSLTFLHQIDQSTYTQLVLTYGSYADYNSIATGNSKQFENAIQFGADSSHYETATATHSYDKKSLIAKQGYKTDNTYTDSDFSVDYDDVSGKLSYRLLFNTQKTASGAQTIVDTLPAGTTFDDSSFAAHFYGSDYYAFDDYYSSTGKVSISDLITHTVTQNADGTSTLTIHIAAGYDANAIEFLYSLKITQMTASTTAFTNRVSCGGASDTQTQTVTRRNVAKTAVQGTGTGSDDSANVVTYRVVLNPLAKDLDPAADKLKLKDALTVPAASVKDVHLLQNSVRLFAYDSTAANGEGTQLDASALTFTYDAASHTTTFTVPDGAALVLEYKYYFELTDGTATASLTNDASLIGADGSSDQNVISVKTSSSSATLEKEILTLYKVDAANYQTTLAGAAFELDKWGGSADPEWSSVGTYNTDQNGTISFDGAAAGAVLTPGLTLYRLIERTAPEGYALSSEISYFVWGPEKDAGGSTYTVATLQSAMAAELTGSGATQAATQYFLCTGGSLYIADTRNSIHVQKVWLNPDGSKGSAGSASITVTLMQNGTDYGTQTLNAANGWACTWKDLDTSCTYTVREDSAPPGYTVTYDNNGGISAGTITVKNTGTPSYTLPETGGTGTRAYRLGGAALAALSAGLYLYQKGKRRRRSIWHSS